RAVVLGVVLGEDEGLAESLRADFRASGLYHLLAVSGQNVALVAGGTLAILWLLGVPRLAGQLAALAAIAAYVLAVGAQPSVARAGVAGALACVAWICARERDRWWFLLMGALALLAWSPYALLDPGFQLSFAAVAAIFVVAPRLGARLQGYPLPRKVAALVAVTAACSLATAPILLLQFGAVPAYALAANALAAPVVAPLLGLSLAAALAYPLAPGAAQILATLAGWCAWWLALCAQAVASLPHAQLSTNEALAAVVAGGGAVLLVRSAPPRRRWRRVGALACLAAAVWAGWAWIGDRPQAWSPPTGLRATFLDVGQGDAALLETPQGAVLVDEGPPQADVAAALRRRGLETLAAMVLTHPQDCASPPSSTRGLQSAPSTSGEPWPRLGRRGRRSRWPGQATSTAWGASASASSGPMARARKTTIPTSTPSCSSSPTGTPTCFSLPTRSPMSPPASLCRRWRCSRWPTTAPAIPASPTSSSGCVPAWR
ncbi:MAG: hypothetical protein C4306_12465, partial [Thermoleophilia bacterium]